MIGRRESQEFCRGDVAYRVLCQGLGSDLMSRVETMLETVTPEQLFVAMKIERDYPVEVQRIMMSALHWMKRRADRKAARRVKRERAAR